MKKIHLFLLISIFICSCSVKSKIAKDGERGFLLDIKPLYIYGSDTLNNIYDFQNLYKKDKIKKNVSLIILYEIIGESNKEMYISPTTDILILNSNNEILAKTNLIYTISSERDITKHTCTEVYPLDILFPLLTSLKPNDQFFFKTQYYLSVAKKYNFLHIGRKRKFLKSDVSTKSFIVSSFSSSS